MPIQSTTVHGPLYSPGLVALKDAKIIFDLTSWDADPDDNVFVTGPYIADIDEQGNFTVPLFTNDNGINQTVYDIYVSFIDENTQQQYYDPRIKKFIGTISLSGSGPFCIADLDITSEHSPGSFDLYAAMLGIQNQVEMDKDIVAASAVAAEEAIIVAENIRDSITELTVTASDLAEGESATASYDDQTGILTLGIPTGATGEKGERGDDADNSEALAARDEAVSAANMAETARDEAVSAASSIVSPVSYEPQALTEEQKEQARNNIGAAEIGSGSGGGNGNDGADGLSAYEIAVENGFVGTEAEWLDSLVGPQGEKGDDGAVTSLFYNDEQAIVDAITAGDLVDGDIASTHTSQYQIDTSVPFGDSVLRDYGIAGVRHVGAPHNEFFGCFFHGRHKGAVTFSGSADGVNFSPLNFEALPAKGTGNETLGGRDPSVFYYRGNWYVLFTGSDEATHDFRMGVSPDLLSWTEHYMTLGATIKTSNTVPLAGGTYPAVNIWAPEVVFNPTDQQLYVVLNVVYNEQLVDDYGGTINNRRPFYSTFDPETKTVGEPVALDMGGGEHLTSYIGHAFITDSAGVLWMAIKDDVTKKMGIWKSDGGIAGTFTKQLDILADISQEGYSIVKNFYREENGTESFNYRIYIDQNRMGPDQAYPDKFAEIPWYIEADALDGTWSDPKRCYFGTPVRHGTVLNMAHNVSPQAMKDIERLRALYGHNPRENLPEGYDLGAETTAFSIRPRNDFVYYVDGVGTESNLTIMDGSADRFYLAAFGGDAGTGINVIYETDGGDVISNTANTSYAIGFGEEAMIEWRRGPGDVYYPASPVSSGGTVPVASETVQGKMAIATVADIRAGGTGPNDEAIVPAKMREVPRYVPGTEGAVEDNDKVWMLDVSTEEMRWLNIEDLPSGGAGLTNWTESATQFYPNTSGGALGSDTNLIREVSLEARAGDGTAGTNHKALFMSQAGAVKLADAGETSNNDGIEVGHFHSAYEPAGVQSGTYVWDKSNGQGLNFTGTLTGALTIDLSDLKNGEEIRIRIANPDSNTVSFTLASGSVDWIGGAPTWGTDELVIALWRIGNSSTLGIALEV